MRFEELEKREHAYSAAKEFCIKNELYLDHIDIELVNGNFHLLYSKELIAVFEFNVHVNTTGVYTLNTTVYPLDDAHIKASKINVQIERERHKLLHYPLYQ